MKTYTHLLAVPEACAALGGISRSHLYVLMSEGELSSIKIGRRRFIPSDALTEWIERQGETR
ncbi:helix-turn-helix domain-containing protein [Hoyosella altamirensis]|uniref:Excisionase family DNA binding protein n=1 Tax=Hoyosella altamirensis TaxID=616997 RepID=A0A839RRN9_9ACTN|nr:helix-turn-helix domain-containing protein [Hoyosella altamirensis]MBB3038989.1 excisionase family DNA binding protein [Hoyosella altamirensis]